MKCKSEAVFLFYLKVKNTSQTSKCFTSKEHLTSSTVGHIIWGSPIPRGVLSLERPADIDDASSVIHFSSKEPREENCSRYKPRSSKK